MTSTAKFQPIGILKNQKQKPISFFATVEFGRLSQNCQGLGICRIEPETQNRIFTTKKKCTSCTCRSKIIYSEPYDIKMEFQKMDFNQKCIEKYFSTGHFILEEDFVTTFYIEQLPGKNLIKIKKGAYPVLELESSYLIKFY